MSATPSSKPTIENPKTSYNSAIWFMLILAALFIAVVNFVNVMSADENNNQEHKTENTH